MLLANKLDIVQENPEKRAITTEEGEKMCSELEIYWGGECSAKTFEVNQIKNIFELFLKKLFIKLQRNNEEKIQIQKLLLSTKKKKKKKVCCIVD